MMTPADLIALAREDLLDDCPNVASPTEQDYRYPTAFLLRATGDAQREACHRQDLKHLFDDTTADVCTIAVTAGWVSYALDARILRLASVRLALVEHPLIHLTPTQVRDDHRHDLVSQPTGFCVLGRSLVLNRKPVTLDTLNLAVWRDPVTDPNLTDELEWTREPEKLAHWLAYRAFLRPDEDRKEADTMNMERAKYHRLAFDAAFGPEVSAQARADLLAYPPAVSFASFSRERHSSFISCCDW
jgi:hypothetical protein